MPIWIILQFLTVFLYAQGEKNVVDNTKGGKTWAVVIGISNYKNIPGLNYADRDARAFYDYLVNTSGGPQLNTSQVKLILNEQALSTEIYAALDWLRESVKENDQVIFYFSGHGDVENRSAEQKGFLLAYDSPPAAYSISGTVDINYLQQYLQAYIKNNKAQNIMLIVDACRSGKLAGGAEGAELTRQVLGQNLDSRIIRILSAQENELSLEGTKWGGGRGVFSYYLIKGIEGMADLNNDNMITTAELAAYLPLAVADATGNVQNPEIEGNAQQALFSFSPKLLRQAKQDNIKTKGVNQDLRIGIPDGLTPGVKADYKKYIDYVREGKLVIGYKPSDYTNCAMNFYDRLIKNPQALTLRASLKSSFIAALQRKSQDLLDDYVKGIDDKILESEAYTELLRARDLIGPEYVLYNYILARVYFLQKGSAKTVRATINILKKALQYEADAPYVLNELGQNYCNINMMDSALYYQNKAIAIAPKWFNPYIGKGLIYSIEHDHNNAIINYEKAIELDSSNSGAYNNLGFEYQALNDYTKALQCHLKAFSMDTSKTIANNFSAKDNRRVILCNIGIDYQYLGMYEKAIPNYQAAIRLDTNYSQAYSNLGLIYKERKDYNKAIFNFTKSLQGNAEDAAVYNDIGAMYDDLNSDDEALQNYRKAIVVDSTYALAYFNTGNVYQRKKDYNKAIPYYLKAIKLDTANASFYSLLGYAYTCNKQYKKGIAGMKKALAVNPADVANYYNVACCYSRAGKTRASLSYLKQTLDKGYNDYNQIMQDDDLLNLRKKKKFAALMKHYFPGK